MRRRCETFNQWIDSLVQHFMSVSNNSRHLVAYFGGTNNSVTCTIVNEKTGKVRFYSVRADRYMDPTHVALAYAWAKYNHEYIFDNDHVELPVTDGMYDPEYKGEDKHD